MAERLQPVAVRAVDAAGMRSGDRVLDVATGTGNAALRAAELGAEVIGVDFERTLLDVAKTRARESGVGAWWELAEATALPVPDRWANVIISVFGVMYSPAHDQAAHELSRCVTTEGRIVLAAWTPGSFMPAMGQALASFLPPPPPRMDGPPSRWGDPSVLDDLFTPNGLHVCSHSTGSLTLTFENATVATDFLVITSGHVMAEREGLAEQGRWEDMRAAMHRLVDSRSEHDNDQLRIELEFLLATIGHD